MGLILAPSKDDLRRQWKVSPSPWRDERRYRDYCERRRHAERQRFQLAITYTGAHVGQLSSDGNSFTTSGIDSSGSNLLVAVMVTYAPATRPILTDNKGNTWIGLTEQVDNNYAVERLFYAYNATVGSGHTFTLTANVFFGGLAVACFASALATDPIDQQVGNHNGPAVTTLQAGSLTPSENNCLVVSGLNASAVGTTPTINSSFNVTDALASNGTSFGLGLAYIIQTSAAATNPTWTAGSGTLCATNASFKAAAAGGGGFFSNQGDLDGMGVGGPFFKNPLS